MSDSDIALAILEVAIKRLAAEGGVLRLTIPGRKSRKKKAKP